MYTMALEHDSASISSGFSDSATTPADETSSGEVSLEARAKFRAAENADAFFEEFDRQFDREYQLWERTNSLRDLDFELGPDFADGSNA
jgi:hypothetical protein